jgi:hypothetical protein
MRGAISKCACVLMEEGAVGHRGRPGQSHLSWAWERVVAPCPAVAHVQLHFTPELNLLQKIVRETKSPKPFLQETGSLLC